MEHALKDSSWVLVGLGFNGYQQLCGSEDPTCTPHSHYVSVSTPVPLMSFGSASRPELKISCTWDSLHIISMGECEELTTGRWKSVLTEMRTKMAGRKISDIKEVGQRVIFSTERKVFVLTQQKQMRCISEQDQPEVCSFHVLEDGSAYNLLKNGQFHVCTISPSAISKHPLSVGPLLPTSGVPIRKVTCGADHILLLGSNGSLFSFGLNSRGQLGHGDIETRTEPTLIAALDGLPMKEIACGHWHCITLSEIGDVYSWGWNRHKQLGHSELMATVPVPTLVQLESEDVNIVSVGCGSKHSAAVSESGVVYGWGWNGYGQLGPGNEDTVAKPRHIELSHSLKPVWVHCGYWNTFALCAQH